MWKNEYKTENLLIDGEHKQILDFLIDYLEGNFPARMSWDFVKNIIADHVILHFAHEEALMDLFQYNTIDRDLHIKEHQDLKNLAGTLTGTKEGDSREIVKNLLIELEKHISDLDSDLKTLWTT